ncbi:MAG TPA: SRPBCC family protein [Candidatus Acidoferrum sp.]|nr:SRPBCC family protein [Candidatus Acidoferrum sp.]
MSTNQIEKRILLRAPIQNVWRALADANEFGTWFGVKFEGAFKPGAHKRGVLVTTAVDGEVAKMQAQYKGMEFNVTIEKMEPERIFSFRWHPYAIDPKVDYSNEPTTLVTFALEQVAEGVMLTVTETGYDQIPLERRAKAFEANEGGWQIMVKVFEKFVTTYGK